MAPGSEKGLLMNVGGELGLTAILMVAEADTPLESVKLTTKTFVPTSELTGVPERAPSLARFSQAGPLTLAKRSGSPGGAMAWSARLAE